MIAIIPAAGRGTRMSAVTGGKPKELLPLGRRTVLERVIDEGIRAGADETIVVSSPDKPEIAAAIENWSAGQFREARLRLVDQPTMRGLADAVLGVATERFDWADDVLVLLGDCVFAGGSPSERMARLAYRGVDGCIAVESVTDAEVQRYGICEIDDMGSIRNMLEKPHPTDTPSRWAVAARYAFGARLFSALRDWFRATSAAYPEGEIPITPGLHWAIKHGFELKAVALQPDQHRVDCGTPEEYESARRYEWN